MGDKLDVNLGLSNNKIDKIAELMLNRDTSKPIKQKIQLDGADKVIKELTTIYGLSENVAKSLENIYKTGKNNRANYLFNYKDETLALNKIIEAYDKFQNTRDNKDRTNFLATTSFVKAGRGNLDFLPNNIIKEYEDIYKEITSRSSGEKYAYSVSNFKSFIDVIEQAQQEQQENIALLENLAKFLSSGNNKEIKASTQLRKKFHNVNYEDLVNYNEDELLEYFESVNKLYKETSEEYLKLKNKLQSREQAQSKLEKINSKISSLEFSHFGKDPYDIPYDEITELQNLKHERNTLKTLMAVPDNFLTDDEMKTLENNDFPHKIRRLQEQLYGIYMIAEQMGFEDAKFTKDAEIDLHDAMMGIPGLIKGLIEKNDIAAETNKQVNNQIDFREAFESEGILNADFKNIRDIIQNLLKRMIESKLNTFNQLLDDDSFIKSVQNEFGSQANEIINRYKTDADDNILKNTLEDYYDQLLRELSNEGLFNTEEYAKAQLEKYRLRINDQNLDDYDSFVNDFLAKINDASNNIKGFDKITIALSDFYDEIDDKGWRKINPLQQRINSLFGIGTGAGINNGGEESSSEEKKVGTSEDYSKILNLLERIYDVFKDIANTTSLLSQSIGIITDENGFNSLLSSLKEVNEYFQNIKDAVIDISSRDLSPTLNIQANQNNDPYAIRKKAQRYKENYENAFNEIGYTNLFSFLAQSNVSEKYEFSADKLKRQFGSEAINGIENKEDQIERIVQFFNLIDEAIDERASEIERATKLLEQGIGTQSSLGIAEGVRQGYYDLRDAMDYITELAKTEAGRNLIAEDDTQKIDFKNMVSPISELRWEMLKNGYSNEQADETIFNMHEELYKEGINRKSALSTIFNNDEKEKIEEITEALREYYITLKEIDPFATKVNDNGDEFNVVDIGDELRDKLKNGTITEDEIRDIYQEKFQNAFNKLSNLFPNIDADQLGDVLKESNIINAFDSIEDAGQHLYMALVNNLDISSVIESGLNKHGFSKLENEVEDVAKQVDSNLENTLNPVGIKVNPIVNPEEFADEVTKALKNVKAQIGAIFVGDTVETVTATADKEGETTTQTKEELEKVEKASEKVVESQQEVSSSSEKVEEEFKQVAQEANNATVEVNKLNTALTESPVDQFINNGVREHLREQYENPNGTGLIPAPNEFTNRDVEYGFTMKDAEEASEEFAEETKEASKAAVGFKTELNEIGDEVLNLLSTSHRYLTDAEGNVISDGRRSFKGQKESGRTVKKTLVEERDQDGNLTGNLAIAVDEETNYAKIVKEAANAVVELTKAEHALALEQAKENPNEKNIKEYTKLIDNLKLKLQAQTDAAKEFANSFEFFYNDQQFDSNYMMKMFNRNVDQAALDRVAKSNINYNNALEAMQKRETKQIDAVNDKLLQQETRLNNIRATYDQIIAPGVSKPVTEIKDLEELNRLYDDLQDKINSLKGTNASKDDMREITQMMETYKLRAKVLKDANNPTKREMGGQKLSVAIQQEIANLDKLIEKSQKYGTVTQHITDELIQQKKVLESNNDVETLYDTQDIRKYNDALLKSEAIKAKQSEEIYNKELSARKEILKLQHQIDMADAKHAKNADEIRAKNEAKIALKKQELDEISKQRKGHTNQDLRNSVETELKRIQAEYDQQLQTQKSITAEVEKRKAEEAHAKAVTDRYEEQLKIEKEIAKLEHQIALDKINGNDSSLHQYDLDKVKERLNQFKADNRNYTDADLVQQNRNILKDLKERYQIEERIAKKARDRNESATEEKERVKETNRLYKELNNDFKKYKALVDLGDKDEADKLRSDMIARQVDLRQGSNYNAEKDFNLLEKFRKWDVKQQVKANKEKADSDKQRANESKEAYKSIEADIDAYLGYLKKEQSAVGKEREEYHKLSEEKRKAGLTALAGLRSTDKYDKASQDKISRKISNAKLDIRSNQSKKALDEEEKQVINLISEYKKLIKNYEDVRKKQIKGTELSDVENDFLNNYTNSITVYEKFLDAVKDDVRYQQRINELLNAREQSYQNINNALTSELGTLKLEEKYTEAFRNKWKELQNDIELFKENVNNGLLNESEINDQINRLQQRIRDIKLERGTSNSLLASDEDINKQMAVINKTLYDSSSMSRKLRDEFKLLRADYAKLLDSDAPQSALDELNTRLAKLKNELHEAGYYGKSFFTQFKEGIRNRTVQTLATYFSFQDIIRYGREFINTIEQLDTALVDLRKTTSMSTTELDEFYYSSNKIAKQMGVTTQEIIQQAANWSRLGYSTKEASEQMAALSSQFAAISPGMDVGTATDGLVSAMKAFHVEVDNVESEIMDPVNRLGNTMATTNEEIVEMLERSSAAMYAANNSIEETLALESAAVQITRNAESTGTAFRTISMRIRGYDEETEELSEEYENLSGKIADLTKTAKSPGGISLFTDKDKKTFKSTYQLLKDISEIWDELSDKQQAQLLEKLAGENYCLPENMETYL